MRQAKVGQPPKTELKNKIVELYNVGYSDKKIGEMLSMPRTTVNYHRNTHVDKSEVDKETTM